MAPRKGRGTLNRRKQASPKLGGRDEGQNLLKNYEKAVNTLLRSLHINPDKLTGVDEFTTILTLMYCVIFLFFAFYMGKAAPPRGSSFFIGEPGSGAADYIHELRGVNITEYPTYVAAGSVPSCLQVEEIQQVVQADARPFSILGEEVLAGETHTAGSAGASAHVFSGLADFSLISSSSQTQEFTLAKNYGGDSDPELLILLPRDGHTSAEDVYRALRAGLVHSICDGPEGYRVALVTGGTSDGLLQAVESRYPGLNRIQTLEVLPSHAYGRLVFVGERDDYLEAAVCPGCTRSALAGPFWRFLRSLAGNGRTEGRLAGAVWRLLSAGDEAHAAQAFHSTLSLRGPHGHLDRRLANPLFRTLTTYGGNKGAVLTAPREEFKLREGEASYLERYARVQAASFAKQFQEVLRGCWRLHQKVLSSEPLRARALALAAPGIGAGRPAYHFSSVLGQTLVVSPFVIFFCAVAAAALLVADVALYHRRSAGRVLAYTVWSVLERVLAAALIVLVCSVIARVVCRSRDDCLAFVEGSRELFIWALLLCVTALAIGLSCLSSAVSEWVCSVWLRWRRLREIRRTAEGSEAAPVSSSRSGDSARASAASAASAARSGKANASRPYKPSPAVLAAEKRQEPLQHWAFHASALVLAAASVVCLRRGMLFAPILAQAALVFAVTIFAADFVTARKLIRGKWLSNGLYVGMSVLMTFPLLYLQASVLLQEVAVWTAAGPSFPAPHAAEQVFFGLCLVISLSASVFYHGAAAFLSAWSGALLCGLGSVAAAVVLFIFYAKHPVTNLILGNLVGSADVASAPLLYYQSKLSVYCAGEGVKDGTGAGACRVVVGGGIPAYATVYGTLVADSGEEGAAEGSWGHTLGLFANASQIYVPAFEEVEVGAEEASSSASGESEEPRRLRTRGVEPLVDCSTSGECVALADCSVIDFQSGKATEVKRGGAIPGYRAARAEAGAASGDASRGAPGDASGNTRDAHKLLTFTQSVIACKSVPVTVEDRVLWRREVRGYLCE